MTNQQKSDLIEVSGNFRRLVSMRELFGEQFFDRQAWACLKMLNGMAGAW